MGNGTPPGGETHGQQGTVQRGKARMGEGHVALNHGGNDLFSVQDGGDSLIERKAAVAGVKMSQQGPDGCFGGGDLHIHADVLALQKGGD